MAMALVGVGLLGFFLFLATRLTAPSFALLYGDLPMEDSGQIVSQLETQGIPYRLANNGTQIMVPSDQVLRLRVTLAEQGLPSGGSVGFEVFDEAGGLGTTNFVQNINLLRALEGELARTISSLDQVRSARVHVVLPRRELFQRQADEPSASVFIRQRGAGRLGLGQVAAIQHLVAAALPGLSPQAVAVVDGKGNLLASGEAETDEIGAVASRSEDYRLAYQSKLKRTIEELLERSVGIGKVRAEVSADINFDRTTTSEETYDPDSQVVRSSQVVEDISNSSEPQDNVSVGNNLPEGADQAQASQISNNASRTEETINYEISKVVRSHIQESGTVERLSVAVLIDGTYTVDEETEESTYVPRSQEELDQFVALVRSAIGFDEQRGDSLEVVNMQFATFEETDEYEEPFLGLAERDYLKIVEILVLAVVAILVILLVLRPLVSRIFAAVPAAAGAAVALEGPGGQPMLTGPGGEVIPGASADGTNLLPEVEEEESQFDAMIDLNKVEGRVKASSVKKIGEIVDKHPDEALTILRGWMGESSI